MSEQANRLLKAIHDSQLTYVELEKKTGIAKSSIQRYASGTTTKIPIDAVKLIADATNSSAAWIMGWDEAPTPNCIQFSKRLKDLREAKRVSQKQLADFLHISQSSVGNWESGTREPNFEMIKKIADYFDVSADYLIGRTDNPQQNIDQQLEGIEFALYGEIKELTDDEKQDILNFVRFTKSQRKE